MCSSIHDGADTATNGQLYSDTARLGYWISKSCPTQSSKLEKVMEALICLSCITGVLKEMLSIKINNWS